MDTATATDATEPPDPTEEDEALLEGLRLRLKALLGSPGRRCREWYFAYVSLGSAVYFLQFARRLRRTPFQGGEFPEFAAPEEAGADAGRQ